MFGGMDYRPQALAVIEQNLADGDRHISRQLDLIAYARSMGWSTKEFEDLLAILQDNQNARFMTRANLLRQLYGQK
jgi:hypothetical protein